jgi:FkbM family methyltransferase
MRIKRIAVSLKNVGLPTFLGMQYCKALPRSRAPYTLTSKMLDYPVQARPRTSDVRAFSQIFAENEYRCLSDLAPPKLIFDLGANVGYASAYFLSRFKDCSVIAVEPDPGNFAQMQHNVAPYGSRVTTIEAAVWPRSERLDLDSRGLGKEWAVRVVPAEAGAVRSVTIPELIRMSDQDRVSLLKVDIEGAETELFQSCQEWLPQVDNLVIELHGANAEKIFHSAIAGSGFVVSQCDELTVCLQPPPPQSP